jgi:hypothetical protein
MILPTRPTPLNLSEGYQNLVALGSTLARFYSEREYEDLKPAQQMAFLNMEAKLRETYIGHTDLLSYVAAVRGVEADRLFLFVESRLKDIVDRSADFAAAAGHSAPSHHPDFPACPDSWKHTRFEFGNIQLSFSAVTRPGPAAGQDCYAIDTDIDLARGFGHVGEWLDNNLIRRGQKTSQTMIYALLFAQGILPVYRLTQ